VILEDLVERAIEAAAGFVGAHGIEAGLIATALVVLFHGHHALSMLQSGLQTARLAFLGAATVGLLLAIAIAMGWISIGSIPAIGDLLGSVP